MASDNHDKAMEGIESHVSTSKSTYGALKKEKENYRVRYHITFFLLIFCIILIFYLLTVMIFAAPDSKIDLPVIKINDSSYVYDFCKLYIQGKNSSEPAEFVLKNKIISYTDADGISTTYVPAREVLEEFQYKVEWDNDKQAIIVKY